MTRFMPAHLQKYGVALVVLIAAFCPNFPAQAASRWCYSAHPDAIFCDDFDHYCIEPPADPNEACPITSKGCTKDNYTARSVWRNQECGVQINLAEGPACGGVPYVFTNPFGAKYPKGQLGHMKVELGAFVLGTDENPFVLEFILNGQNADKLTFANTFMELAHLDIATGTDYRAPTDYIYNTDCGADYPVICQQNDPPAECPDIATAPHVASIAVGAVAYLDKNPCDGPGTSNNEHLAVFDGYKWWTLPGSFMGRGSFLLMPGLNRIRLTIASSAIAVEMTSGSTSSWCEIPRDYLGGFNKLHMGFGQSCLINQGTWTCADELIGDNRYQCINSVMIDGHYAMVGPVYDNIVLHGGEVYPLSGACCLNDGTCMDITEDECQAYGGRFSGPGSACMSTLCCPYPFADGDGDGDVDAKDFGIFQACYSSWNEVTPRAGCECYDRNDFTGAQGGNGRIDADDFAWFDNCFSGPTIPVDVDNPPPGCIP